LGLVTALLGMAGCAALATGIGAPAGATSGGWVATEAPLPGDASSGNPLVTVSSTSCVSATVCTAVGRYVDASGRTRPLIETWSGGAWGVQEAPQPATASTDGDGFEDAYLNSVSCTGVGTCVAVGSYNQYFVPDKVGAQFGLIDTESGGVWSAQAAGQPSAGGRTQTASLTSVSCVAAGTCVAVGHFVDATAHIDGLVETRVGGSWETSFANLPTGVLSANGPTSLTSVSCAALGDCVAVGSYVDNTDHQNGLIERMTTGSWLTTAVRAPEPSTSGTDGDSRQDSGLVSVSCSAITFCAAVGSYDDATGYEHALDDTLYLGDWFDIRALVPGNAGTDGDGHQYDQFSSVSCPVTSVCVAVGAYTDTTGAYRPLVDHYAGGTTLLGTGAGEPADAGTGGDQYGRLYAVACATSSSCVAVGDYEDAAGHQDGLDETLDEGTWLATEAPVPTAAADPLVAQYEMSCSGTTCASVGNYHNGAGYSEGLLEIYTPPVTTPPPVCACGVTASPKASGYDLVGSDGGVFVFPTGQSGGFYGSLPGLHVSVDDIVGMVPTADDRGYFLVGSDGGVFAFGNAPFENSLPGIKVSVNDIVGIVPTSDDQGYFLVGRDGGVFTFGNAPFLGSLPSKGISVDDVIGIAANPADTGYWVVGATGKVYSFGAVTNFGSAPASSSPVSAIESTTNGGGYWIVTQDGDVYPFGDAGKFGNLPALGVTPAHPVIGLVPTSDDGGYWLIGSDGGIFAFGDAPYVGSLPGLGVAVTDVVGAVPTTG
jgi:hypothetical protein